MNLTESDLMNMKMVQAALLLLLLSVTFAQPKRNKSLLQLSRIITCYIPNSWPIRDYGNYGCYCGLGGSGTPVDDLDRCCAVHDKCYSDARTLLGCSGLVNNPYMDTYSYICINNKVFCLMRNNVCDMFICECDRKVAECIARSQYNKKNKDLPKSRCK